MAITRMSTTLDHAYVYDLNIPGTLLPAYANQQVFLGTSTGLNASASYTTAAQYARWGPVGTVNPTVCFNPSAAIAANASTATAALHFGAPQDSWFTNYTTTYATGSHQLTIFKQATQTLTCTFIVRTNAVPDTTTGDGPNIQYGLSVLSTSNTKTIAYRNMSPNGNPHSATTGLAMNDINKTNTGAASLTYNWAPDTEFPVSIVMDTAGNWTTTTAGVSNTVASTLNAGTFSLVFTWGTTTMTNLCGIRNVRITVS